MNNKKEILDNCIFKCPHCGYKARTTNVCRTCFDRFLKEGYAIDNHPSILMICQIHNRWHS